MVGAMYWWAYVVGFGVVGALGAATTYLLWRTMDVAETMADPGWEMLKPLPPVIGVGERVGYTAALISGQGAFIGVWLAIKMLGVAPWQHENPQGRYPYQRNLVVTLVSLGWGAVGAQVIRWNRHEGRSWNDSTVLILVALAVCLVLWIYLGIVVPAAAERYKTKQRDYPQPASGP